MTGSGAGGSNARDPRALLDEMLASIQLIQDYTGGATFEEFQAQPLLQDAVSLRIVIIGEAASRLPDADRAR